MFGVSRINNKTTNTKPRRKYINEIMFHENTCNIITALI